MIEHGSKLWYLAKINLFSELTEATLKEIAESSKMHDYTKNAYIETPHDDDEVGEIIYFLKKGEVEIAETTGDGKKMIIDILKPGDVFGYSNILESAASDRKRFIRSTLPATVCVMPRNDFLALIADYPNLALKIIKDLSLRLAATEARLRDTALLDVEARVLQGLERLADQHGTTENGVRTIMRRFTHEEFAQIVGIARETTTRALTLLVKKGKLIIDRSGNIIIK